MLSPRPERLTQQPAQSIMENQSCRIKHSLFAYYLALLTSTLILLYIGMLKHKDDSCLK